MVLTLSGFGSASSLLLNKQRYERLFDAADKEYVSDKQKSMLDKLKKGIDRDIEKFSFNTAVPKFMSFVNDMNKEEKVSMEVMLESLDVIRPFTPSMYKNILKKLEISSYGV